MTPMPIKNSALLFRVAANETVIFVDLEEEDFFWELEGLAVDMWKDIDGKKSWQEIKNLHRESFSEDEGDFEEMAEILFKELIYSKIIFLK